MSVNKTTNNTTDPERTLINIPDSLIRLLKWKYIIFIGLILIIISLPRALSDESKAKKNCLLKCSNYYNDCLKDRESSREPCLSWCSQNGSKDCDKICEDGYNNRYIECGNISSSCESNC